MNKNVSWRLIDTGFNDPYMNMAIDDAIVQLLKPDDPPVLRFFDWSQPSISIGYSQRVKDVLDVSLCRREGVPFVRRPTGGGVVFHGIDVTYSVVLPKRIDMDLKDVYSLTPKSHQTMKHMTLCIPSNDEIPTALPRNREISGLIQSWIKNGLDKIGIKTSQYPESKKDPSGYCFVSPSYGDIMIENCKVGGLAGRRIKHKMLFQGYLYFEDAVNMLKFAKGIRKLDRKAMNLRSFYADKEEIKASIINNWRAELVRDKLSDKEEELAGNLSENKYGQDEWNFVR